MLEEYVRKFPATKIIGSGGNINRLFRLARLKGPQRELPVERLQELYDTIQTLTVVERMEQFKLKEDRADGLSLLRRYSSLQPKRWAAKASSCPISRSPIPSQMAFGAKYR